MHSNIRNGLIFKSNRFYLFRGAYNYESIKPQICDKCKTHSGAFHAHGGYKRSHNREREAKGPGPGQGFTLLLDCG